MIFNSTFNNFKVFSLMGQKLIIDNTVEIKIGDFEIVKFNSQSTVTNNTIKPQSFPLDKIPIDLLILILGYNNQNGLDLKEYRNQIFINSKWQKMAKRSITNIDLIELKRTTVHRKCTLLAHIFADRVLDNFPNLKSLKVSFANIYKEELFDKLFVKEKRSFEEEKAFFSSSKRLDKIDANMEQNIVNMLSTINDPTVGNLWKVGKFVGYIFSTGWEVFWYQQISKAPILKEEADEQKISADLGEEFVSLLSNLHSLEELVIAPGFDLDLKFIAQLPRLKRLHIITAANELHPANKLNCDNLIHANLETLRICDTVIPNFDHWKENLPKLKELDVLIGAPDVIVSIDEVMNNLITNVPNLEVLKIRGGPYPADKIFPFLYQLPKLRRLNLAVYFTQNGDLNEIIKLPIKELILMDMVIGTKLCKVVDPNSDSYDENGLNLFKLCRPNVSVIIDKYDDSRTKNPFAEVIIRSL